MKRLLLATACVLMFTPAFGETPGEKLGVNAALGISPTTQDFVTEAATSGLFEIKTSQLAEERGDDAAKGFAKTMITDHQKIGDELKDLVQTKNIGVTIPTELTSLQQSKFDDLGKLQGADFNKQYRDDQYSAHKDAVSLFQRYAKGGENTDLRDWAAKVEPTLEHHLDMARDLDKQAMK
jgi:putative membrane protein